MSQKSKITTEEVIKYLKDKDCELISKEYINMKQKLEIRCKCGNMFIKTLDTLKNKDNRCCCKECSNDINKENKTLSYKIVKEYIESKGCKLISNKYISAKSKLKVQCSCGDVFEVSFNKFKDRNQTKCYKCIGRRKWNYESVKEYVNSKKCELIDTEYINRKTKMKFICNCGKEFTTDFHSFLYQEKTQCDICTSHQSKLETAIETYLDEYNILYSKQYTYPNLKSKKGYVLRFDFAILLESGEVEYLIECDGNQHYVYNEFFSKSKENFDYMVENDKLKNNFCEKNNIKLIRIPYKYKYMNNINTLKEVI